MSERVTIKSYIDELDEMTDDMIDFSDIPPLTDEQLGTMKPLRKLFPQVSNKGLTTVQLDTDVVRWFKEKANASAEKDNYQTLLNTALRSYIQQQTFKRQKAA
ncbi:MAG: BrnA antitoxin family protein [Ardenticatenaceae bacterium]